MLEIYFWILYLLVLPCDNDRKCTTWPGTSELRIFKLLVRYITDPTIAEQFVDILMPLFKKKDSSPGALYICSFRVLYDYP